MSFNKITVVGYLGRDPELRYTSQGTAVCKMSVATSERRRGANGEEAEEHTTWFRVTVWGRQAELANEYLGKGRQVYVEGRLRLEEYADREGNPRISPEVTATDIQFLGSRNEFAPPQISSVENRIEVENQRSKPTMTATAKATKSKRAASRPLVSIEEDEIPF